MFENIEQMRKDFEAIMEEYNGDDLYDFLDNCGHFSNLGNGSYRTVYEWEDLEDYVIKVQNVSEDGIDYGASEAFLYERAVAQGLDWAFAATTYLGRVGNYMFYLAEYCICDEEEFSSSVMNYSCEQWIEENSDDANETRSHEELASYYYSHVSEGYPDTDDCLSYADGVWGIKGAAVFSFIDHYNINDLHGGNWGYREDCWGNRHLVIVDYGGYNHNILEENKIA